MKTSIMMVALGLMGSVSAFAGAGYGFTAKQVINGPGEVSKLTCTCDLSYGAFPSCAAALAACQRIFPGSAVSSDVALSEIDQKLVAQE